MAFEGQTDSGFPITLDADSAVGGTNSSPRPMQMIALGLAGCTAMDVISILRKKCKEVTSFEVRVDAPRAEGHPKVFTSAVITYMVSISAEHSLEQYQHHSPDLVVVCGDITQFGPGQLATNFLNQLPIETLAIPGNIDTFDVDHGILASNATALHLKRVVVKGIPFIGIGREIPSPLADIDIADGTKKKPLSGMVNSSSVLVTHVPPYKLQDKMF